MSRRSIMSSIMIYPPALMVVLMNMFIGSAELDELAMKDWRPASLMIVIPTLPQAWSSYLLRLTSQFQNFWLNTFPVITRFPGKKTKPKRLFLIARLQIPQLPTRFVIALASVVGIA